MSNTISQNPMLAKLISHPAIKSDSSYSVKEEVAGLVHAQKTFENTQNTTPSNTDSDWFMQSPQAQMATAKLQSVESSYHYSGTMSVQLTTKEGDTVSLKFKQRYAQYQTYTQQSVTPGPSGVRYFESKEVLEMTAFEEQFAFSVEGDLNEDELNALFGVFEQVDKLANNFFDGNIEKALSQVMELEIDYGQLQSFKLNLTQTDAKVSRYQQAAVAEYKNVQDKITTYEAEEYGATMFDLPEYLQQLHSSIETLGEQFENAQRVLDEILSSMVRQHFPERLPELDDRLEWLEKVQVFHERLAGYAEQSSGKAEDVSMTSAIDDFSRVTQDLEVENNSESSRESRENETLEKS